MRTYEPDDQVFMFGFSRGAYPSRAVLGMLRMFGLLSPGNEGYDPVRRAINHPGQSGDPDTPITGIWRRCGVPGQYFSAL
jgi:uncharacterized protein (DUF2235 family)